MSVHLPTRGPLPTSPRLRLLNVIRSLDPRQGGPAEGLRQSVLASRAQGHAEEVLSLDAPEAPWLAGFPAPVHALGPVRSGYGYTPRLRPWLVAHAGAYDAVVVHGLWQYPGLGVWRALRQGPVPYFVYCHGMLDPWFKRRYPLKHLKKWLYWPWGQYPVLRDARAVLFTAEEESRLAPLSFRLYRARHAVVGYGLALDALAREADAETFHARFPETRGRRTLLFMGRLHPKKGCDLLIEAFAAVAPAHPSLHLVMAGPDAEGWRARLMQQAGRLGVAGRITWCGMLSGALKWSAFRAAEVFVLPSHQENFGIAVAESLAMGVPVLVSRQINIWREIVDSDAGFADADTAEGTQRLLRHWLSLPAAARESAAAQASACFERHFQMASTVRRLVETITPHLPAPLSARTEQRPIHGHETHAA